MALTLEIPSDLQAQIERVAASRGTDAQAFVLEATRRALEEVELQSITNSQRAQIQAARGSLRGLVSSDALLAQRRTEAQHELDNPFTIGGNTP